MAWEILNKEGNKIEVAQLNKEAKAFWKIDKSNSSFAQPLHEPGLENEHEFTIANWYDRIGGGIHNSETSNNWGDVIESIVKPWLGPCLTEGIALKQPGVKPYVDLINHWESLGYTPRFVKD